MFSCFHFATFKGITVIKKQRPQPTSLNLAKNRGKRVKLLTQLFMDNHRHVIKRQSRITTNCSLLKCNGSMFERVPNEQLSLNIPLMAHTLFRMQSNAIRFYSSNSYKTTVSWKQRRSENGKSFSVTAH